MDEEVRRADDLLTRAGAANMIGPLHDSLERIDRSVPVLALIYTRLLSMEVIEAASNSRFIFSNSTAVNESLREMLEAAELCRHDNLVFWVMHAKQRAQLTV